MPSETVELTFKANMRNLTKQLADLPDVTTKEAQRMVIALEKEMQRATRASKAAVKATQRESIAASRAAAKAASDAAREFDGQVGDVRRAAATLFGDGVNQIDDYTTAMGSIGPVAKAAVKAIGPVGLTAGAAAIGITAYGAAVGAAAYAVVSLVAGADDLIEANKHLAEIEGFKFDPDEVKHVLAANAAMDSLSSITGQIGAKMGSEFAPAVERGTRLLLALGLMGLDAMNDVAEGTSLLTEVANRAINLAMNPLHETMLTLMESGAGLFLLTGRKIPDGLQEMIDRGRDSVKWVDGLDSAFTGVESSLGEYGDRVDAIIDATVKKTEADKATAAATHQVAEAYDTAAAAADRYAERLAKTKEQTTALQGIMAMATAAQADELTERDKLWRDAAAQQLEVDRLAGEAGVLGAEAAATAKREIEERLARDLATQEATQQAEVAAAQATAQAKLDAELGAASDALNIIQQTNAATQEMADLAFARFIQQKGAETEEGKKAALLQFRVKKLSAIKEALIAGGLATMQGIAQFGPPPSPFGIAAIAAAAVTTTASVATIAAQSPPSFHTGGLAPDEMQATLRKNEAVLTRQAVETVNQLNSGDSSLGAASGGVQFVQMYGHKVLDVQTKDAMRTPTSALRAATRTRRVGHRQKKVT